MSDMTDIAQPGNPVDIGEAEIYAACVAFVQRFAGIEYVYQGWQNLSTLPPGTNAYAVVSLLTSIPINTPVERMIEDDVYEVSRENELVVQIDVSGEDDGARRKAEQLHLAASSSIGPQFFNARGMSILYAEDVRDLSFIGDAKQFVRRYTLTLHCAAWSGFTVNYDGFNTAGITRIENVDAHHPHPFHHSSEI